MVVQKAPYGKDWNSYIQALKVSKMQQKKDLAKGISEVSWYQFRTMIDYKANWYGKKLVLVNPKHTSQRCNKCGCIDKKIVFHNHSLFVSHVGTQTMRM